MQQQLKTSSKMHNVDDSCTIFTINMATKLSASTKSATQTHTHSHTESIACYVNQSLTEFTHFKKSAYIYLPEY